MTKSHNSSDKNIGIKLKQLGKNETQESIKRHCNVPSLLYVNFDRVVGDLPSRRLVSQIFTVESSEAVAKKAKS